MGRVFASGLVLLMMTLAVRAAEPPEDVLAVVPEEAWVVFAAPKIGDLDKKLTGLVQQLLNQSISPLGVLRNQLGLIAGIRDDAGGAVVLMPVEGDPMKSIAFLVPTTDLKELLSVMEPEDAGDGLSKVMLAGSTTYAAAKGGFAVLARSADLVKKIVKSEGRFSSKCAPPQLKRFAADDVSLLVNVEAAASSPLAQQFLAFMAANKVDTSWLTELRALQISLRFDPKGIRLGAYADSKPGSRTARIAASQIATDKSLLVGLPKENYVLALGSGLSAEGAVESAKALENLLSAAIAQAGPDAEPLARISQKCLAILGRARGAALTVSALPEGPQGLVGLACVTTFEGGATQALAEIGKIVESVNELLASKAGEKLDGALLELTPSAEKAGAADVARLLVRTDRIKEMNADARGVLQKVVGEEGLVLRLAAVDSDRLAVTFGGGLSRTQTVVNLARENQSPLDEDAGINSLRQILPKERSAEMYVAVDRLLKLAKDVARVTDAEFPPINVPELPAPVGIASAPAGKTGTQSEVYFPMELIQAIRDLMLAARMGGM